MEEIIIQSKKINKDKTMRNMWLSLAAILAASILIMAIKYIPVKKAQDIVVSGILALTDDYNEYENDRKEMLRVLGDHFDLGYSGGKVYDIATALYNLWGAEEDYADGLLEMAGYDYKTAHEWVSYGTFGQYYFREGVWSLIIISVLAVALAITNMLYLKDKKAELSILENTVIGKMRNGKTVQFMLKDIKSVETTKTHGLKILGVGIKYDIHLIQNAEEMKNVLMNMLAKTNQEQPAVAGSSANDIKEYKELLDAGIITQEEFDEKKKQLLNI